MAVLKDLIVHGPSRFLNAAYYNKIDANEITTNTITLQKIAAKTNNTISIVAGLVDVQGELHTNAWTNANIANIGGSFYISPTVEPTDGTTTISITRNSATSWTISATGTFATDFIKSGTATSGVAWPANSLVLITGDVVVGDMVYPLGTLKGTLSAQVTATAASTSKTITITGVTDAQNNNAPSVLQELYSINNNTNISNAPFKKGKISLYKLGSNPIGILMTSMGTSANSLMDIYGGVSTNPNVRIGHLAGLPNINGSAPTGWGIYTDNGYFSGVVVSNSGKIANFTINGSKLYSNGHDTYDKAVSGIYIGDDYISFGSGGVTYFNTSGTGKIGPWTLSTTYLRNGNIAGANNTSVAGVYLGTDGLNISGGSAASTAYIYKNGSSISVNIGNKLTWNGATLAIDGAATIGGTTASTVVSNAANGASAKTAIDNLEIGGRNLALNSHQGWTSTSYNVVKGFLSEDWIEGETYTIQIKGTPTSGKSFGLWRDDGRAFATYTTLKSGTTDIWMKTFTCPAPYSGHTIFNKFSIYDVDSSGSHNSSIEWIKIEKGNRATDWTPAPEDTKTMGKIDTYSRSFTTALWKIYGAYGHGENWNTGSQYDNSHLKVGDTAYLTGTVTDGVGGTATIIGTVEAVNSSKVILTSTQLIFGGDSVDSAAKTATNYIAYINSTDGIKIASVNPSSATNYVQITSNDIKLVQSTTYKTTIDSTGMKVYAGDASNPIAQFGATTIIGKTSQSHINLDYHSLQLTDKESNTYFEVKDLRDSNGDATITTTIIADGKERFFNFSPSAKNTSYTVTITDDSSGSSIKEKMTNAVEFNTIPSAGAKITITYTTSDIAAKKFSFGPRDESIGSGGYSSTFGVSNIAQGFCSSARGAGNKATGQYSFAEGAATISSGYYSHGEGYTTQAIGIASHAEGYITIASGHFSHAEGDDTVASGDSSHAEGSETIASDSHAHAEGWHTEANGESSHAEGEYTKANGDSSHAEGFYSEATGLYSHAQGMHSHAIGNYSNASGRYIYATGQDQTVIGRNNYVISTTSNGVTTYDAGNYAFIIGNGVDGGTKTNALIVDWSGNVIGQGMAGMIQMFAGSTAPTGWLLCNGTAVSRTTYAQLFAVIGTTYGSGDESTTFNLPDFRDNFPVGAGSTYSLNSKGGAASVTLSAAQSGLPAHSHLGASNSSYLTTTGEAITRHTVASGSGAANMVRSPGAIERKSNTASVDAANASTAHENRPPYIGINFIICTGKTS